ncbi:MAG: 23S rRNA (adenine(2503)-C(2))-methyltransferase RlmN [Bradymonadales bacterium]|nr:23S rRNA (adenine(2503)-C(2))-methyltransferase RlmN [Bradymonadales bacterium]
MLKGMDLAELERWAVTELDQRPFRGRQIYRWMYQKCVNRFDQMTDIARDLRERLEQEAELDALHLEEVIEASDGTQKLLFRLARSQARIESVLIPAKDPKSTTFPVSGAALASAALGRSLGNGRYGEQGKIGSERLPWRGGGVIEPPKVADQEERVTLCVSSQVGCALACAFCRTGSLGFVDNLTVGEIVDQVVWARRLFAERHRISNIVFMGMGEPLNNLDHVIAAIRLITDDRGLNFSHRKVTLSTAGLVPQLERLATEQIALNLAISLNATTDELRSRIMPINRRYPLDRLLACLARFPLPKRARITIEYVLLAGINDSDQDAQRLVRLIRPLRCKVNLIPFNPFPSSPFQRPDPGRVAAFQGILQSNHFNCRIRDSRGDDQLAACGQLGGGGEGLAD